MTEDEPFLRAMLANPDDRVARLVYADWLDERNDPRGEYARLAARVAELHHGHERAPLRRRMLDLQPRLPSWWVAIVGGLRAVAASRMGGESRIAEVARILGREPKAIDEEGYHAEILAAAANGLTGAVAYVEQRGMGGWQYLSDYRLTLRDAAGRKVTHEPYLYSLYRGCAPRFLEWYGDAVFFIYREKHRTYIIHFGFDIPPRTHELADNWILEGREIAFLRREEPNVVRRVSLPHLAELPSLTPGEAQLRDVLPKLEWL